jgi:hypothetical protein
MDGGPDCFPNGATSSADNVPGIGWVLMAAGAVGLLITLVMFDRRRTVITNNTTNPVVPPEHASGERIVDGYGRRYRAELCCDP